MLKYPKAVPSKTATGRAILSFVVSAICVGESPVQLQSGVRFQPHFKLHFEGSSEQQLFLSYSLRTQLKPLRQELVCGLIAERPVNAGRLRPSSETAEVGTESHLSANPTNQAITQKTSFRDHEHRELHAERESYARWTDRRSNVWRNLRPACGGCHEVRLP